MNALFKNVLGAKAVASFSTAFRGAGGGEAGIAAVDAILKKFSGTVSEATVQENLGRSMGTKESKAIEVQNRLDKISASFLDKVLPSLEKLAPSAEGAANSLASIVAWAASNPLAAVGVAVAGSVAAAIAKAAIGDAIGKAVAGGISGKGLAIGAITATVAMAYLAIREYNEQKQKAAEEAVTKREESADLVKRAQEQLKATGRIEPETVNELIRRRSELEGSLQLGKRYNAGEDLNWFEKIGAKITDVAMGEDLSRSKAELEGAGAQNVKDRDKLNEQAAKMDALLAAVKDSKLKGPLDVNVLNQPAAGGPSVDQSGRAAQ
jgi:hypothetical protein